MQPMQPRPAWYEIRVAGHLPPQWMEWFDGLDILLEEGGSTLLSGALVDQAALHGVLKKIRDLGMTLVSVNRAQSNEIHPYSSEKGENE